MTAIHIALLRGVNVGGHKPVSMSDLLDMLTELGFLGARSLLQSGNLVFRSNARRDGDLERLLEAEAEKHLDLCTNFFVRTVTDLKAVVAHNPFRDEAKNDPAHLVVMFLKTAPARKDMEALQAAITGPETVRADGRHVYIVYPTGIGRSRLTNTLLEDKLGIRGTARNWNTVLKLAALANK
jgi:uncharacterized protein (DUF1697 family)